MPDNVIPIYSTRAMQEYVENEPGVARFVRDTFFKNSDTYDTDTIDVDIIKNGRPIACMVKRAENGNLVEDSGYETRSVKTGYMNEFKIIEINKYMKRRPSETQYNYTSPGVQAQQAEAESFKELIDRFNRAEEIMCIQALVNGTFTGRDKEGNIIYQADFRMNPDHKVTLASTDMWDATDGIGKNKLMQQIRGWIINYCMKNGGKMPTHMILGGNALNAFLNVTDPDNVTSGHNCFTVIRGDITPTMKEMGVFFLGTFPELGGIEVIGYNEWYDDPFDGGTTKPVFPTNTALLCCSNARYRRQYGRIDHKEAPDFIDKYPYTWSTENRKRTMAQLESAPIMVPFEVDTIVSATVTTGD